MYINNATSISFVEMGLKGTSYMQESSQLASCVYSFSFLKPGLLFYGFLISYDCIMYRMGGPIFYKCIILHDQIL
jgi:hypothetical protein